MELVFPFKNLAVNSLWTFTHDEFIIDYFVNYRQSETGFWEDVVNEKIEFYKRSVSNFQNEILQIVNTTNSDTINHYFQALKQDVENIEEIDRDYLLDQIQEFNSRALKYFEDRVNKESDDYFNEEQRKRLKHLEEYEAFDLLSMYDPTGGKVKRVNYNFYCVEINPGVVDIAYFEDYASLVLQLMSEFLRIAEHFLVLYKKNSFRPDITKFFTKSIIYVEGEHDVKLITRAAEMLGRIDVLEKIELRQRSGFRNLDKIWNFYKNNSLEIIAQKKVLLYDCDTKKNDEDFGGYLFKRVIPTFKGHIISKGIENLFSSSTTQKAIAHKKEFVDFTTKRGTKRGIEFYEEINEINEEEKANFCDWICKNGDKDDFRNFEVVFKLLDGIVNG